MVLPCNDLKRSELNVENLLPDICKLLTSTDVLVSLKMAKSERGIKNCSRFLNFKYSRYASVTCLAVGASTFLIFLLV